MNGNVLDDNALGATKISKSLTNTFLSGPTSCRI